VQSSCLGRPNYKVGVLLVIAYYLVSFSFTTTVPRYLLISFGGRRRTICQPIFERIIPNTESDTNADGTLIKSLFGNRQNPAFVSISTTNKSMPRMRGKFCSTASSGWILFTTFDESNTRLFRINEKMSLASLNLAQPSNRGGNNLRSRIDEWGDAVHCLPFDSDGCSSKGLLSGNAKIFELEHQELV
jgi:hypothetical protein